MDNEIEFLGQHVPQRFDLPHRTVASVDANRRVLRVEVDQLGLDLGVEEHRLRGRDDRGELRLLGVVGQHGLVHVENVDDRLGRHQAIGGYSIQFVRLQLGIPHPYPP